MIQKDPNKETAPNNNRPIICVPMMWKILTAQIREEIYYSLISRGWFPDEQKGCRKGPRGTAELLYIDQHILNESKKQTEKSRNGLDRLQKGVWYGSAKLDNKLSQNVQNIIRNHKLHKKNHEKLESWINSRRKKLGWSKSKEGFSKEMHYHPYYL